MLSIQSTKSSRSYFQGFKDFFATRNSISVFCSWSIFFLTLGRQMVPNVGCCVFKYKPWLRYFVIHNLLYKVVLVDFFVVVRNPFEVIKIPATTTNHFYMRADVARLTLSISKFPGSNDKNKNCIRNHIPYSPRTTPTGRYYIKHELRSCWFASQVPRSREPRASVFGTWEYNRISGHKMELPPIKIR